MARVVRITSCALLLATLLVFVAPSALAQTCGNPGQDGPGNISGVVNTYFPTISAPSSSVTVAAGTKNITLYSATGTTPIAIGDLVLIIQMQDATINTANTTNYGAGNGTGAGMTASTAGYYEFGVSTTAVPLTGGTLTLAANLVNAYTDAPAGAQGQKRFQVVRVPQYSSVTFAGTVTATPWNGTIGGIVVFDVAGALNLSGGGIDVSGKGFRGGGGLQVAGGTGARTDFEGLSTEGTGASKGEGIAGTPRYVYDAATDSVIDNGTTNEGWTVGSFLRGAPGNAGGGGTDGHPTANDENTGGGGGGNGGAGGLGGNSWNSNLVEGGIGGAAFPATAARVVMGGGGGAGTSNNTVGNRVSGAPGGGIVIIRTGSISGGGTILANGANGPDSDNDGTGGGGAGGSVVIVTRTGTLAGVTISANGGNGGDAWPTSVGSTNAHGPGGGGGGGVVYQSGSATVTVAAGLHGTTTTGLLAYGSANGSAGVSSTTTAASIPGTLQTAACLPALTVTKTTTTALVAPGGTATYKITVKNAASVAAATQVNISDTLPQPVTNGFTYIANSTVITLTGGATRPTSTDPAANATVPTWSTFIIPAGGQVDITFNIKVAINVPGAVYQNPAAATYLDPTRTVANGTKTSTYDSASSTAEDVTVRIMLAGTVFADVNHDGNQDNGEDWSSGTSVYVNLVQGGAVVQSVNVTAGTGQYAFGTAAAGSYTAVITTSAASITPTAPAGWIGTMPTTLSYSVNLTTTNPVLNLNFGLFNGTKVSGTVFNDNGVGSGTANNGAQDGTELGLTNVTVKATDAGSTTYDQTTTDSTGKYTLWLPASAASVRIVETNASGYVSTGASLGNSGGTYTRATDTISFTNTGLVYAGLNFGEILNSTLSPNGALQGLPNTSVVYAHSFIATTTGQVTLTATDVSSPNISGYAEIFYRDTNCNGLLESGDPQITAAIAVTAGTTVCLLVKNFIPAAAPFDATDSITLTASFSLTNASPALVLTYTVTDVTTVGAPKNSGLRLEKAVDKATATSGTVITYTVTYINDSSGSLSNIVINDSTPAYTTFQSAACVAPLPTGLTACTVTTQPAVGAAGTIQWTLTGSMNSAQTGNVTFSVKVN